MIAVSMLLIAGSAAALGFGWVTANESLIWASIVATGTAAVLLALAYYLSFRTARAPVDPSALASEPETSSPPPETQEFTAVAGDEAAEEP
jgi:cation transporter-like permease